MRVFTNTEKILLYHGSKSGIKGEIQPISRAKCDFGKGFYMGTNRLQPLTLICSYEDAVLYEVSLDMNDLKCIEFDLSLEWAFYIAHNRGKMEKYKNRPLYKRYQELSKGIDLIIGYIANDRMYKVMDRFFDGEITDVALLKSLSALSLGKQYVALSQKACNQIHIVSSETINEEYRLALQEQSQNRRRYGYNLAEEICKDYRRQGRYFDEIVMEDGDFR